MSTSHRTPALLPEQGVTATDDPRAASAPKLEIRGISKEFRTRRKNTLALSDINLTIDDREFVSLIGRSGCGKTTLFEPWPD